MGINPSIAQNDFVSAPIDDNWNGSLAAVLREVAESIAPVWPLKDYVAVNPFMGLSNRTFLGARAFLRVFSNCETLMPLAHYADLYSSGELASQEIDQAISEIDWPNSVQPLTTAQVIAQLLNHGDSSEADDGSSNSGAHRRVKTVAEYLTKDRGINWLEAIRDEITKHCAAHFDEGQAAWKSPWRHLPLFAAWRSAAQLDHNLEFRGLKGLRRFVGQLPECPEQAIVHLLTRMRIPESYWQVILLCQAYSILGWCSWAKYQDEYAKSQGNNLIAILAIRLAYDVALSESQQLKIDWQSFRLDQPLRLPTDTARCIEQVWLRYVLLVASEIRFRNRLVRQLRSLQPETASSPTRSPAQLVFCIDVRSERYRRHIEAADRTMETLGFAGFFGLAIDFQRLGEPTSNRHLPVLIQPQLELNERLCSHTHGDEATWIASEQRHRVWRKVWHAFQTSVVGCFGCVETTGVLGGVKSVKSTLGLARWFKRQRAASGGRVKTRLEPQQSQELQIDLLEKTLRALGICGRMSRLVAFCGHSSRTENNPLAAGLDCGACGGHSGEPNARLIASLLNQADVRRLLRERGLAIPEDTYFLAAVHNTTTEELEFIDSDCIPESHLADFQHLQAVSQQATLHAAMERLKPMGSANPRTLWRQALDWSEVRPEWGLAGNAAMVVGPRGLTLDLIGDARVFLHSYEASQDPEAAILETIMTAPLIVANWINMQYYASTVDNQHFGSGNKTVHNVVGRFGILSGNAGDLRTGLPWQSLHTGSQYQHQPLRLTAVIAANRSVIEAIIRKHQILDNLIFNGWVHVLAVEEDKVYRFDTHGQWHELTAI